MVVIGLCRIINGFVVVVVVVVVVRFNCTYVVLIRMNVGLRSICCMRCGRTSSWFGGIAFFCFFFFLFVFLCVFVFVFVGVLVFGGQIFVFVDGITIGRVLAVVVSNCCCCLSMSNNTRRLSQTPAPSTAASSCDGNAFIRIPQTTFLVLSSKGLSDNIPITKYKVSSSSRPAMVSNFSIDNKSSVILGWAPKIRLQRQLYPHDQFIKSCDQYCHNNYY